MKYNELTRRYFESASLAGTLAGARRGAAGDRAQGTWVQFDLEVAEGVILNARFLAFGCPHTIAVAQWLAANSCQRPLERELPHSVAVLRTLFAVPLDKLGRLLIIEDAWSAAVAAAIDSAGAAPISPARRVVE